MSVLSSIEQVAVVGAGTMGSGIAQVFAQAGYSVVLIDILPAQLERGLATIARATQRQVERGRLTEGGRQELLARIRTGQEIGDAAQAQLVVEAIVEQLETKLQVLTTLDNTCPPETILTTNTSSLSITQLAAATKRPAQVIGMHFINPAPVMKLVEVIRGLATSDRVHATVCDVVRSLDKTPVTVKDAPGFVLNRLLIPMLNEAAYLLMEGVASAAEIDTVMRLGANHPMGPLALADLIGLDTCLAIMQVLHRELGDDKYRPCPLLRQMVAAGYLGRKSGRGFYRYDDGN